MKDDDPNDQGQYTYADAMNQWAAGQDSYLRRMNSGILHPRRAATRTGRVLGYLWRVAAVIVAASLIYWVMITKHIKSKTFASEMAAAAAEKLGAEEVTFVPFRWKENLALSPVFRATGGSESFFHSMNGTSLQFRQELRDLFRPFWKLEKISISALDVELRSGGSDFVPRMPDRSNDDTPLEIPSEFVAPETELNLETPLDLDTEINPESESFRLENNGLDVLDFNSGGLGIRPDFSRLEFGSINVADLALRWGLSEFTGGALEKTSAKIWQDGANWKIEATGGTIRQNWLPGLRLTSRLDVLCAPGLVTIAPTQFQLGQGAGTLEGTIKTGHTPDVDVTLNVTGVPLDAIVGKGSLIDSRLSFAGTGSAHLTGSTNTSEGIVTAIDLDIDRGSLRRIPAIEALAAPTSHGGFRQLQIEGGKFLADIAGEVLTVRQLRIESGDITVEAAFTVEDNIYDGTLQVTVPDRMLEARSATAALATADPVAKTYTFEFPLAGDLDALTLDAAAQVTAAFKKDDVTRW